MNVNTRKTGAGRIKLLVREQQTLSDAHALCVDLLKVGDDNQFLLGPAGHAAEGLRLVLDYFNAKVPPCSS